tara:strand:- start:107 stop:511 length:405 start_codon:yes stop_codon:yes gene_type:complete
MKILYSILWWVIAIVSCIDLYWAIRIRDSLPELELNPLGVYLMELGGLELFMALKMLGTILVLFILSYLYRRRPREAWCVIVPLFVLQLILCCHLFNVNAQDQSEKRVEGYRKLERQLQINKENEDGKFNYCRS